MNSRKFSIIALVILLLSLSKQANADWGANVRIQSLSCSGMLVNEDNGNLSQPIEPKVEFSLLGNSEPNGSITIKYSIAEQPQKTIPTEMLYGARLSSEGALNFQVLQNDGFYILSSVSEQFDSELPFSSLIKNGAIDKPVEFDGYFFPPDHSHKSGTTFKGKCVVQLENYCDSYYPWVCERLLGKKNK